MEYTEETIREIVQEEIKKALPEITQQVMRDTYKLTQVRA